MQEPPDQQRCPVCGEGVFTGVVYEEPEPGGPEPRQSAESYEVLLFSCGHRVKGARLAEAESDEMTVEQRESDETTDRVEPGDVGPAGPREEAR
jgi:hypothetical protein